jgi:hypothetical protein
MVSYKFGNLKEWSEKGELMTISKDELFKRSLELSKTSNEHSRAASQACILINGGAATAVIAYLSKDKLDPSVIPYVTWSLSGYCLGVLFAALMLFCATHALDYFSQYWLRRADEVEFESYLTTGYRWWYSYHSCTILTFFFFALGSFWFARGLNLVPQIASPCGPG